MSGLKRRKDPFKNDMNPPTDAGSVWPRSKGRHFFFLDAAQLKPKSTILSHAVKGPITIWTVSPGASISGRLGGLEPESKGSGRVETEDKILLQALFKPEGAMTAESRARVELTAEVPTIGEKLLCLLVPPKSQEEKLGDFAERFHKSWVPKFGPHVARYVYLWHVLMSSWALARIAVLSALLDWLTRKFGF